MKMILVLSLIFFSYCTMGNEDVTLLLQPHVCYESTYSKRQVAFKLSEQFTDPPPVIKAVFSVNSFSGINAIRGSYTHMEDHLLQVPGPCIKTISFGAKSLPSTHQVFAIKLYTPKSTKSFSNIKFITKIPLVNGMYLLRDDQNLMSIVGNFNSSLGDHLFLQPTLAPDYSKILVPALYEGKCACVINGRNIHKLGCVDTKFHLFNVGNYKNIELKLIDTAHKENPREIYSKILPAFPCSCKNWEFLKKVSAVIPNEFTDGLLVISFNDIDGISKKSAQLEIIPEDMIWDFSNSDFVIYNLAVTKPPISAYARSNPIYLYLLKFDTLTKSCGTDEIIKTTSRMLGTEVYEFTYSKKVYLEQGRLIQELAYYSSNISMCDDIKERKSLEITNSSK